jgi:uncharacterized protein (TIGR00299 family) protein
MNIAYCDCFSGISGDMFLAALLDAGLPIGHLKAQWERLHLTQSIEVKVEKVQRGAVQASSLILNTGEDKNQVERNLAAINGLIENSGLSTKVKGTSQVIFERLAEAEARVHGLPIEDIHFHEVGALDAILDITGAAIGLEYFEIEKLYSSSLPWSSGQVASQHGALPLPAPATLELLRQAGARMFPMHAEVELVTPTGAAILSALAEFEQPQMRITGVGVGAGQRELAWPNVLRFVLGENDETPSQPMVLLETNIDDMNPQIYGHVMDKLYSAGALDVYFTPIHMKKNRPGVMVSVIAHCSDEYTLSRLLLEETSTLGIRVQSIVRHEAGRAIQTVQTDYGEVPVKLKLLEGRIVQVSPEYEDCARLAASQNVPLIQVYRAALIAADGLIGKSK